MPVKHSGKNIQETSMELMKQSWAREIVWSLTREDVETDIKEMKTPSQEKVQNKREGWSRIAKD